ncbi:MAG: RNA polymerase sigma factor [Bacteroidales bacterium]|nr:RNA polymerase sigma factor [Bacteroidales bacterium]
MTCKEYNTSVSNLSDGLYRFALRYTGDGDASRDAVQDSFVVLWEHRREVSAEGAKAYLYRVLYYRLVDAHRREQHFDRVASPEPQVQANNAFELHDSLQQALDALNEVQRSLVLLRDLEGYSYKEMAAMLSLSEQQVMVYLYRARKTMKQILNEIL